MTRKDKRPTCSGVVLEQRQRRRRPLKRNTVRTASEILSHANPFPRMEEENRHRLLRTPSARDRRVLSEVDYCVTSPSDEAPRAPVRADDGWYFAAFTKRAQGQSQSPGTSHLYVFFFLFLFQNKFSHCKQSVCCPVFDVCLLLPHLWGAPRESQGTPKNSVFTDGIVLLANC